MLVNKGDLIFVRTNGAKELSGRCAIFQNEIDNCYYASYLIRLQLDNYKVIPDFLNYYTQTKAICNETNYCQDYYVSCNTNGIIQSTPITGAVIQHGSSWKDPRNDTEKKPCS